MEINLDLYANMEYLHQELRVEENFDLIYRFIRVGDRTACIYFLNGFVKSDIMEKLLEFFYSLTPEDLPEKSSELTKNQIPRLPPPNKRTAIPVFELQ